MFMKDREKGSSSGTNAPDTVGLHEKKFVQTRIISSLGGISNGLCPVFLPTSFAWFINTLRMFVLKQRRFVTHFAF